MIENEPSVKKSNCSYCGDAPINHRIAFIESVFQIPLDKYAKKYLRYVPFSIKNFADAVPEFLFRTSSFLGFSKFSKDITKANNFRSKIIWEEAKKRGILMEQVIFFGKPLDYYRAFLNIKKKKKFFYFESIPVSPELIDISKNWDDKVFMKKEFEKNKIPIPAYFEIPILSFLRGKRRDRILEKIFHKLPKPIIVKPRVGSRGRHTVIGVQTLQQFKESIPIGGEICAYLVAEEHLKGNVCRATMVNGILAGFYKGEAPTLIGDGKKTIKELIEERNAKRENRVEPIRLSKELDDHIARSGFKINDILPAQFSLTLTHRIGRLFGGKTIEMIEDIHPSFISIFEKAAKVVGIPVMGFDSIIPDPTKPADSQKWGIIECNTLPFIDLHYYALLGKPRNIAGMIWDLWK